MSRKLKVGWFSFTCCEDSTIVFVELMNDRFFEWREVLDFRYFRTLKGKNDMADLDIAFVEGAISNHAEEETVKKIRANCKKLVAIGSCACTGAPANQRNFFDDSTRTEIQFILDRFGHRDKVSQLSEIVKVDDFISGCPMDEAVFLRKLGQYLEEFGIVHA
jgi:coenzyme F420-reducing hydrogenase gamma subunit